MNNRTIWTRQRMAVTPDRDCRNRTSETIVDTIETRNYQRNVDRWTQQGYEAGSNILIQCRGYNNGKRSDKRTIYCHVRVKIKIIDEHLPVRREQHSHFLRREITVIALRLTDFLEFRPWFSLWSRTRLGRECKNMLRLRTLNVNICLEETDKRSGYSKEDMWNILLLFYYFFLFIIVQPSTA